MPQMGLFGGIFRRKTKLHPEQLHKEEEIAATYHDWTSSDSHDCSCSLPSWRVGEILQGKIDRIINIRLRLKYLIFCYLREISRQRAESGGMAL
jgi:hypothetical protein